LAEIRARGAAVGSTPGSAAELSRSIKDGDELSLAGLGAGKPAPSPKAALPVSASATDPAAITARPEATVVAARAGVPGAAASKEGFFSRASIASDPLAARGAIAGLEEGGSEDGRSAR
jgi:hypothetical protein